MSVPPLSRSQLRLTSHSFELVIYTNISGLIEPSQSNCVAWVKFEVIAGHVLYSFIEILLIMRGLQYFSFFLREINISFSHTSFSVRVLWEKQNFGCLPLPYHHNRACSVLRNLCHHSAKNFSRAEPLAPKSARCCLLNSGDPRLIHRLLVCDQV
jgi:hypothetical protein